jgi:hypothetical protein
MTDGRTTRVAWRLFWAWNDESEESWLAEMARRGWHLRRPALVRFVFDRGEPAEIVYRLDYHILRGDERGEYLGLFRAAGWEHVGEVANWHYFRTAAAAGSSPDIFTDTESRVGKYRRLLLLLAALFPIFVVSLVNLLERPRPDASRLLEWLYAGGTAAQGMLVVLWLYAFVRIGLKIAAVRRRGGSSHE